MAGDFWVLHLGLRIPVLGVLGFGVAGLGYGTEVGALHIERQVQGLQRETSQVETPKTCWFKDCPKGLKYSSSIDVGAKACKQEQFGPTSVPSEL